MIVDSVLNNTKAYFKEELVDCSIALDDGKIFKIGREANMPRADSRIDLKNLLVLPGLIDVHVHLRDEGKVRKEDFYTGTAAAAHGGFTTVVDMPNNDPVTMSPETLRTRMEIAENKVLVNVGFRSEFPKDAKDIEPILRVGALGFKLFMAEQIGGLDLDSDDFLEEAFTEVAKLGASVAVHAEDKDLLKHAVDAFKEKRRGDIAAFLEAHSERVELKAIQRVLNMTELSRAHVHFCHVSTAESLDAIAEGKKLGLKVNCEVTPHNLLLSSNDLKRIGFLGLSMPPVRGERHSKALWNGLKSGAVDVVASDHAPHLLKEKEAESVWDVKVGVPGLETTLSLLLTEVNRGRFSLGDLVRSLAEKPADLFALKGKGRLREGSDGDLTLVDLYDNYRIDPSKFLSKAKYSPFDGREVVGRAVKTYVGGRLIIDEGEVVAKPGTGRVIRRETTD